MHPALVPVHFLVHFPTNGGHRHHSGMDVKAIVAANLQTLIDYAADHREPYGSVKSLAAQAKVSRPTIDGVLGGKRGTGIDTLEAIAAVYELSAWQLLIPNLNPANPPCLAVSESEKQLWRNLQQVAKAHAGIGGQVRAKPKAKPAPTYADNGHSLSASGKRMVHKVKIRALDK